MSETCTLFPRFVNQIGYKLKNLTGAQLEFPYDGGCKIDFGRKHTPPLELEYVPFGLNGTCVKVSLNNDEERIVMTPEEAWTAILKIMNSYGGGEEIFAKGLSNPAAMISGDKVNLQGRFKGSIEDRDALKEVDFYLIDLLGVHYWNEFTTSGRGRGNVGGDTFCLQANSDVRGDIVGAQMIAPTTLQILRKGFSSNVFHFNTLSTSIDDVVKVVEELSKLSAANKNIA